ncbi:putative alpha/beta fold family hydrolase [Fusarium proliferatum ET1]|uniref:Probable alpha/beta fold family hydrolase n=1 Tax=Fusarium proliferatum (strain ET1) TaxID=1227346 RepID=A0A1L7W3E7_FUSPR|nr:putative alpha/beta fold family hydrolase [Fusarium proliferatum ET1]CZR47154.1 probable alpha/beta fold family hydrolase [Fusarium proliferatum ET1]
MLFKQLLAFGALANGLATRQEKPIWLTLPPTPDLPAPITHKTTHINNVSLWMQEYNKKADAIPIVMDHGGLGYSAYFGSVISRLIKHGYYVIAVDRRGHGRSTFNKNDIFTYEGFAQDTNDLLKSHGISEYNVVGWSDGAITTLAALIDPVMSEPIKKAFIFGGSANPEQTNATFSSTDIFSEFVSRCRTEYAELQPHANFTLFGTKVATMEATLPQFTDEQLGSIDGPRVIIVGAEHEEAVNRDVPEKLHKAINGSHVEILTGVSHFAPLQDPDQFTKAIEEWFEAPIP